MWDIQTDTTTIWMYKILCCNKYHDDDAVDYKYMNTNYSYE